MQVHVKIIGALHKPLGKDDFDFEVADDCCLEDLLVQIGYHRNHLRFFLPAVNGTQATLGHKLSPGDEVTVFMPMSGG
jgi:molybdopterin converting factor small subunit